MKNKRLQRTQKPITAPSLNILFCAKLTKISHAKYIPTHVCFE